MPRAKVVMPTPEDDAAIQRGIDADPDARAWTDEDFARARPASAALPPALYAVLTRRRGPGKKPAKVPVSLRLPPEVAEGLRAMGPGWQTRAGEALARLVKRAKVVG